MMSIITVKEVPIPIFGKDEFNKLMYATKTLQLNASFASKGCAEFWQTTQPADLPATEAAANTNKEKAVVKMNRSCCSILITSFGNNPSLNAMIQQSTGPGWATGQAWMIKQALDN